MPKSRASVAVASGPAGSGRLAVRFIPASRSASHHWLSARRAAGAERDAQDRGEAEHRMDVPGAASRPHSPVNTTRLITRGLVSAKKSRQSAGSGVALRAWSCGHRLPPAGGVGPSVRSACDTALADHARLSAPLPPAGPM